MWPFSKSNKTTQVEKKSGEAVEKKSAILGTTDELGKFLLYGYGKAETANSALRLYEQSSAVSIPINKIVDAFVGIDVVLEIENEEITKNHDIIELLNQPSPYFDRSLFMQTIAINYLVTDECHIISVGNNKFAPVELQPISPSNVSIMEGSNGTPVSLQIGGNTLSGNYTPDRKGRIVRYFNGPLRELRMIRGFSTKNNSLLRGQSRLVNAANEVRQNILGGRHNVSLLEKGGRVSLVFHYDDIDLDEIGGFDVLKNNVRSQYGGADNAGTIGVSTGGGLTIKELGKSNKDMDFALLQRMAADVVANQYNVPLPLVNNESTTFNNYGEARLALYDDAVLPLFDKLFTGIGSWLLPRYGLDPKIHRLTYDPLSIPALRQRMLEELKTRSSINIESDNELRQIIGREPYEGGDTMYKPANLQPVGSDEFSEPYVVRNHLEPTKPAEPTPAEPKPTEGE